MFGLLYCLPIGRGIFDKWAKWAGLSSAIDFFFSEHMTYKKEIKKRMDALKTKRVMNEMKTRVCPAKYHTG